MTDWAGDTTPEWDELVVCPTCKRVARPDEDVENEHEQPCPECGFTQLALAVEQDDDGRWEVRARWNTGEGAQLFLADVQRAISLASEFWDREEAEEERIDDAITQMRLERQQRED